MPRSSHSRSPVSMTVWLVAAALVVGAVVATTRLTGSSDSNSAVELAASSRRHPKPCATAPAGTKKVTLKSKWGTYRDHGVTQHIGDGQEPLSAVTNCTPVTTAPATGQPAAGEPTSTDPAATDPGATDPGATDPGATDPGATDPGATDPAAPTTAPAAPPAGGGLEVLARDCTGSKLPEHDGFQNGDRCVTTEFGRSATPPTTRRC
jgi:hypothetical protein